MSLQSTHFIFNPLPNWLPGCLHCLHCSAVHAGSHFLSAVTVFLEHVQIAYSSSLAYTLERVRKSANELPSRALSNSSVHNNSRHSHQPLENLSEGGAILKMLRRRLRTDRGWNPIEVPLTSSSSPSSSSSVIPGSNSSGCGREGRRRAVLQRASLRSCSAIGMAMLCRRRRRSRSGLLVLSFFRPVVQQGRSSLPLPTRTQSRVSGRPSVVRASARAHNLS